MLNISSLHFLICKQKSALQIMHIICLEVHCLQKIILKCRTVVYELKKQEKNRNIQFDAANVSRGRPVFVNIKLKSACVHAACWCVALTAHTEDPVQRCPQTDPDLPYLKLS